VQVSVHLKGYVKLIMRAVKNKTFIQRRLLFSHYNIVTVYWLIAVMENKKLPLSGAKYRPATPRR